MKILKFKKTTNGKYKITLDNNTTISLYEDVIINNNLLLTKTIEEDELDDLLRQNNDIYVYSISLNYISVRQRSVKEISEYLNRKDISKNLIDETIDKLIKKGYLNDFDFAKAYINDKLLLTNKGPHKIKNELVKYGISNEIIDEVIEDIDNDMIKEKLSNLMEKQIKLKKGSSNGVKTKLVNYFINLGYDRKMILDELSNYKLKSDLTKLKKEYDKLYSKYKDKYSDSELSYIINNKLLSKGYTMDDINEIIE